jgi:hypothetical protein
MLTSWLRGWRVGMILLGIAGTAVVTMDQIDYPSGFWSDGHGHRLHVGFAIASIAAVAFAAIVANAGQEYADSHKEKSLAQQVRIDQILGVILANIVEYSMKRFDDDLKNLRNELHASPASYNELIDRLEGLLDVKLPSITRMAAYLYLLRQRMWWYRLIRRARFSIGADRPEHLQSRYKWRDDHSISAAARDWEVTWERIELPGGKSAVINNTPLFSSGGMLIGILSIVAEPGSRSMEDRLLDRAMTQQLAGYRAALTKVVERPPR